MRPPPAVCPTCGGPWIDGRIAVPIVGSLRFTYRLGTNEVATEVAAQLCQDCGHVELRARDPELIARAQRAAEQGRTAPRRVGLPARAATDRPRNEEDRA